MEGNNKGSNLGIIITTVIITLMAVAIGYLLFMRKDASDNNTNTTRNEINNQATVDENKNQKQEETKTTNTETQKTTGLDKYIANLKKTVASKGTVSYKIVDDGSLPKTVQVDSMSGNKFTATLSENGKITVNGENGQKELSNISSAKNIDVLDYSGGELFILLNNGDVYRYRTYDYSEQHVYVATKMNEAKNITKFVKITIAYKAAGPESIFGAIDSNGDFVKLGDMAV